MGEMMMNASNSLLKGLTSVCLWAGLGVGLAEERPQLLSPVVQTDSVRLAWEGGTPPFQVQYSTTPGTWSDIGDPTDARTTLLPANRERVLYRVHALGHAGLGAHVGQLRVMEGEFGEVLSRHRLKSIWDFHKPSGQFSPSTPAEFFRGLIVRFKHLEGTRIETWVGTLESFPNGSATVTPRKLTFRWLAGVNDLRRAYVLELDFSYEINKPRASESLLSDPSYTLSCTYAAPQMAIDWNWTVSTTNRDVVNLAEIDDNGDRQLSHTIRSGGAAVTTRYAYGREYQQGNLPFIYKTFILSRWTHPTVCSGLTSRPFMLSSRFAQSYDPFHHNFVETFWMEPELEPGIDPTLLEELRAANIRMIIATHPSAFPEQPHQIRILGFDGSIREL